MPSLHKWSIDLLLSVKCQVSWQWQFLILSLHKLDNYGFWQLLPSLLFILFLKIHYTHKDWTEETVKKYWSLSVIECWMCVVFQGRAVLCGNLHKHSFSDNLLELTLSLHCGVCAASSLYEKSTESLTFSQEFASTHTQLLRCLNIITSAAQLAS